MDYFKIGQFIQERRKKLNLTQKQLGEKLNVTDKAVSKWERGLGCPDVSILGELSEILDVGIGEILNGEYNDNLKDNSEFVKKAVDYSKKITEDNIYFKIRKILYIVLIFIVSYISFMGIKQFIYINSEYKYEIKQDDFIYNEYQKLKQYNEVINQIKIDQPYLKEYFNDLVSKIDNLGLFDLNGITLKKHDIGYVMEISYYINDINNRFVIFLNKIDNENSKYYLNFLNHERIDYVNDAILWDDKIYFLDMYDYKKINKSDSLESYYKVIEGRLVRLNKTLEFVIEKGDKNE